MTSRKLRILIFTMLLLISNPIKISQEKIPKQTTNNSQIVNRTIENKNSRPVELIPMTAMIKTNKNIKVINILVSYYSNSISDCGNTRGISASGKNLIQNSRGGNPVTYVAAPSNIKFGTLVNVKGIGICQVEDRGSAIKYVYIKGIEYMKLDVFVPSVTRKQLLEMGVVKTKGYIIEQEK